jgi:asparagine synthase (glutamine-hydrolysing)
MCGLVGILSLDGAALPDGTDSLIRQMGRQLAPRGPDDEQLFRSGPVCILFRRLSIIDLVRGQQPLANEDGNVVLAANGEIFNHRELRPGLQKMHSFRSDSDCEVLLHLYEDRGLDFLDEVRGMYGLAIWDSRARRLVLARDRLGIKPMFYARVGNSLLFASEIKALLAHPDCPRAFSWERALADPLLKRDSFSDTSLYAYFDGVEQLPAGELLVADVPDHSLRRAAYWTAPSPSDEEYAEDHRDQQTVVKEYRELLEVAVTDCLMSDVEFGVFLSGGLDSVSVCGLASKLATFHTFSVRCDSTISNGDAAAARLGAHAFGLPNHQVLFPSESSRASPEQWKHLLWACETPLCGAEQFYKYHLHRYAKATRPALKVMLSGQGSDEFNGGYSRQRNAGHDNEHPTWLDFSRKLVDWRRQSWLDHLPRTLQFLDEALGVRIFNASFLSAASGFADNMPIWQQYSLYMRYELQMYNLWHEDRTAAANGIENRVPFLDHRLVEFTLRIPPRLHSDLFWEKRILREAMRDIVPPALLQRPKVAFYQGPGVRFTNRLMLEILLAEDAALIKEAFESSAVFDLWSMLKVAEHARADPEARLVPLLLMLTNMELLSQAAHQIRANYTPDVLVPYAVNAAAWLDDAGDPGSRSPSTDDDQWGADLVLCFSENTYLASIEAPESKAGDACVIVDGAVAYEFPEEGLSELIAVLRCIDGVRSAREIVTSAGASARSVREWLAHLIEVNVLTAVG